MKNGERIISIAVITFLIIAFALYATFAFRDARKEAYEEGYEKGYTDGYSDGHDDAESGY